ncbi:MAG TPA: BolA family protein [Steroidobacter sp.]
MSDTFSPAADRSTRPARIRAALESALRVEKVELVDESHLHAGHAGARDGRGHFRLHVVSPDFEGRSLRERHQLVYRALAELMRTDIHALSITALTPAEAAD